MMPDSAAVGQAHGEDVGSRCGCAGAGQRQSAAPGIEESLTRDLDEGIAPASGELELEDGGDQATTGNEAVPLGSPGIAAPATQSIGRTSSPHVSGSMPSMGQGAPLSSADRAFFESRFDFDFGQVRVHHGPQAATSAASVGALAYTVGNDVVLGAGARPQSTAEGRRFLGHELAHVVQQSWVGGARYVIQRQPTTSKGDVGCPVPELQEALNATGSALPVNGRFGPLTQTEVRNFQTSRVPPLLGTGVCDASTWAALHVAAPGNHGLPVSETTTSRGWGAGNMATVHQWRQRLTPTTRSFQGCSVTEADPGGGSDTCHFPGSTFAPFTGVTGGTWGVDSHNRWGNDFVGWFSPAVTYYRAQGRAPCTASFPQSMRVVRPSGDVQYKNHTLTMTIGATTVSSTRDGQSKSRTWP
ncbi:Putative peptidoglycan binding domain-containing protein [Geodermatophilus aquaeductus]|uniref:Peptidoglycan binding domain-containing protein n=1 Tax=Geodermatophilus aquaeductus TaxID=1564161 RepID=A0A521DYC3_9ACTN|nr:DUF4157 domain-containing protein [Geodermatophilus aquaeductus]SMO76676.1 Putative peptidoglycan binding domain-containing protein [Geodermatophilus aquaeductus]